MARRWSSRRCRARAAAENAIGILGAEVYDANRATLTALAFRAQGPVRRVLRGLDVEQPRDKKNVRDGHYTVWSPTVWMNTIERDHAGQCPMRTT